MARIENILVNGKTYKVQTLGVLDSLYFQAELIHALGSSIGEIVDIVSKAKTKDGNIDANNIDAGELGAAIAKVDPKTLKEIQPKILAQVITPENNFLGDEATIENWFSRPENTGDVWEVLYKGAVVLLGEYRPSFLKGMKLKAVLQEATEVTA